MSTPFKMKGITPLKHLIGKHPSKKDGHKRSDHKKKKKDIKKFSKTGLAEGAAEAFSEFVQGQMAKQTPDLKLLKKAKK